MYISVIQLAAVLFNSPVYLKLLAFNGTANVIEIMSANL